MKIVDHNIKYITLKNTIKCDVLCDVKENDQENKNIIFNNI